ncbi:ribonuclease H-like domain-containing protein [Desarmillaria tabescens]|uniref:RNA exonuclease 4 n=1 Tax=Armillaria tabescens TaxID=1929756 RepID=A0AA39NC16_ARMTA|nr:ribonuclease H-like domain-containing protein [Desarmillaria tabescens]KAK0462857.1 ribonuclease H-like domain-containing protein [Desarmillaria tabescens]
MVTQKKRPSASSNWLALQKKLPSSTSHEQPRKRRKTAHSRSPSVNSFASLAIPEEMPEHPPPSTSTSDLKNGESLSALRRMVAGEVTYTDAQKMPGKYLSIDCEMVGIGIDGSESSLARVTVVNFYGAVQMDEFVRQKERVVDYRTRYSGIRPSDMVRAKPFEEVQKQVSDLLQDRILVGHAVYNDLKVLLLSHPRSQLRDTQYYAGKFKVVKSRFVALRNLVKQELDITIQDGEHSSLTDARATMAVYRLHRKEWEKGTVQKKPEGKKRKRQDANNEEVQVDAFPGGGRKGVSSGLATVVRRKDEGGGSKKTQWWKELGAGASGSKGSMKV